MATYSDATVNVVYLNYTSPGPSGTIYTVPAGRRAKLRVLHINQVGGVLRIADHVLLTLTDFPDTSLPDVESNWLTSEIWLYAGDVIVAAGTNYTLKVIIEEYSNP